MLAGCAGGVGQLAAGGIVGGNNDVLDTRLRAEGHESLPVTLRRAPVVEVVGLEVGHDRDPGGVLHERTVGLVGLHHERGVGTQVGAAPG